MRRAAYWAVLSTLVITFIGACLVAAGEETFEIGPVDFGYTDPWDDFYIRVEWYVDREKAGYTALPKYYPPRRHKKWGVVYPGGFAAWNEVSGFEACGSGTVDYAHWPEGDPGLGSNNPLPPLVRRAWRRNFDPDHVFLANGTAILAWGAIGLIEWWLRRRDRPFGTRRGFDVTLPT